MILLLARTCVLHARDDCRVRALAHLISHTGREEDEKGEDGEGTAHQTCGKSVICIAIGIWTLSQLVWGDISKIAS